MPILGSFAGGSARGLGGLRTFGSAAVVDDGAVFAISNVVLSTTTASVTFSSIPSTYAHLQLRCFVRDARVDILSSLRIRMNGDTTSNYAYHCNRGDTTNVASADQGRSTGIEFDRVLNGANSPANSFGILIIDIPDYVSANKYKTVTAIGGAENASAGTGVTSYNSGLWNNTSAITSLTIFSPYANMLANSRIGLYGIKGA